jgi:hypothetical protein
MLQHWCHHVSSVLTTWSLPRQPPHFLLLSRYHLRQPFHSIY